MLNLRRVIIGIFTVLLGLCAAVLLLVATLNLVNWNRHLDLVASTIERFTTWDVLSIEGFDLHIGSQSKLAAQGLQLGQSSDASAIESISVGAFELQSCLWPLLFRDRFVVDRLIYTDGRITLRDAPEGEDLSLAEIERMLQAAPSLFLRSAQINNLALSYRGAPPAPEIHAMIEQFEASSSGSDQAVRLSAQGILAELPFQLQGELGSYEQFTEFDAEYPIRLTSNIAGQSLEAYGVLALAAQTLRFDLTAEGSHITQAWEPLLAPFKFGNIPPYKLKATLSRRPGKLNFNKIDATLGYTHVYGDAELQLEQERPYFQADIGASLIRYKDLAPLIPKAQVEEVKEEIDRGPVFSRKAFSTDALQRLDADVRIAVAKYKGDDPARILDQAMLTLKLDRGLLTIDPLDIALARGSLGGQFILNARSKPLEAQLKLGLKNLHLTTLLAPFLSELPLLEQKPSEVLMGQLAGNIELASKGQSAHQLASELDGKIQLALEEGRVSAAVIEVFGFDLTETLTAFFAGQPSTDLRCMVASFDAKSGKIDTDVLLLATADSNIVGRGTIDLNKESVDYTFETRPKDFSIGAARSPVRIQGPLNEIEVEVDKKGLALRSAAAVALGALVNPLLGLLPFIEPGLEKDGQCAQYVGEISSIEKRAKEKEKEKLN